MAQLEQLQKSIDALKISHVSSKISKGFDKSHPPIRLLKQEALLAKSDYILHCNLIAENICSPLIRNHDDFQRLLTLAIEAFLILCDDDDTDIRLAASDAIDRTCLSFESNMNRIIVELYREIERNGPSRSLRVALNKFAELCTFIRPARYRAYISKLFPCISKIIYRSDDELLQETLCQFIGKASAVLVPYAADRDMMPLFNAYLPCLNSPSSVIRRSAALALVALCENSRRPQQFFQWLLNNSLNLLSTVNVSMAENSEKIFSGIFVLIKFLCPKAMKLLEDDNSSVEGYEMLFDNLIFIYQHLLTSIKFSVSSVVIVAALEALNEYINAMPYRIYQRIVNLNENSEFRSNWSLSRSPTALSAVIRHDRKYESNVSITSSINYIENINDDQFNDELFKKAGISWLDVDNDQRSTDFASECGDSEMNQNLDEAYSEVMFDQESELNSLTDNKMNDFDDASEYSSANYNRNQVVHLENDGADEATDTNRVALDQYNLGPLYSLEYSAKLLCLKFLLSGQSGHLIADEAVRVSIKSLALSCFASLAHIFPEALFLSVTNEQQGHSQSFVDLLLYASHPDPNLKGCVAVMIGKFFDKVLSLPTSYSEFVSHNFEGDLESVQFASLFSVLCRIAQDASSIATKQALASFQFFLPKLLQSNELCSEEVLSALEMLATLKNNPYWLVKVELVNLLSNVPYTSIAYLEQIRPNQAMQQFKDVSLAKMILEDIVVPFAFDADHRVRQATISSLGRFVENLCLNSYLLSNDPLNVSAFKWMLSNFHYQHSSKVFHGLFPDHVAIRSPLDRNSKVESTFSLEILGHLNHCIVSSNLLYFVRRFQFELSHNYSRKSLFGAINALGTLAKLYPPSSYSEAWQMDTQFGQSGGGQGMAMLQIFVELLTKNQSLVLDLYVHQNLLYLSVDLLEGIVSQQANKLRDCADVRAVQSESQLFAAISPHFSQSVHQYFLHLLKIIVAHAAIAEENSAIFVTFIHNLHSKNHSQLSSLLKRRGGKLQYSSKEKEQNAIRKELSSKGSKKQESFAYDPLYHRLFDFLRSYHRNKKVSIGNKSERCALLTTSLSCMGRLLEMMDFAFVLNYLEDFLIYLKLIFYLDPTTTILTVRQLLKCIFAVNYVSLFVDLLNDQVCGKAPLVSSSTTTTDNGGGIFKCDDINSLYNSCLSMPYIKLNEFYNSHRARNEITDSSGAFLTWLRERVQSKLGKTLNLSTSANSESMSEGEMKKLLSAKIQLFEPLVVKSLKFYSNTNDHRFQGQVAELLAQLVQLHVNYCALDTDNLFISFVIKQFEFLENVPSSATYEPLMKRLLFFLVILSNGRYISDELIDLPKVIQLCDGLIANGHHQMALQGLNIIVDDIFFFKHEQNVDSLTDLEATREVVLAYCFKLLDFPQSFDLLNLIVNYYRNSNRTKWTNLSIQIVELLTPKLMEGNIRLDSVESFESLQTLIYRLCSTAFSGTINLPSHLFAKNRNIAKPLLFEQWLAKTLLFFRLAMLNLNENELLSKTMDMHSFIEFSFPASADDTTNQSVTPEDAIASLLLSSLQMAIAELYDDLHCYRLKPSKAPFIVYLLSQYSLSLVFIFQSGFFPKITASATNFISSSKRHSTPPFAINDVSFDFARTHDLFLKVAASHPNLTISWLNLLYVLNFENLPSTLSKLIEQPTCDFEHRPLPINLLVIKRFSLILLCDYLTENLDTNVEYLSWLIINHLRDIIDLCYEVPVMEFLNSIHRKSSSSGLFLQAINSRCADLSCNPLFASKLLHCLERAHMSQSLSLLMFLLERYLFNPQLAAYYTCSKYAEIIAANRLASLYNLNFNRTESGAAAATTTAAATAVTTTSDDLPYKNLLTFKDLYNLKKLLKNTSYVKLSFTVQMIKNKCFSSKRHKRVMAIKDPLSEQRNTAPEINKKWFVDVLKQYWSLPQRNVPNAVHFLDRLPNEDIVEMIASDQVLIENLKQILAYIVLKVEDRGKSPIHKAKSLQLDSTNRGELAEKILKLCHRCMQYVVLHFPLGTSLRERQFILQSQIDQIHDNENFVKMAFSFLPPFEYLVRHLPILEGHANFNAISSSRADIDLLAVYSACVYRAFRSNDLVHLIDLLTLIRSAFRNPRLFAKLCCPENIHYQASLINCIFYLVDNCFILCSDVALPAKLTSFGHKTEQFEHIFGCIQKMLQMVHWLEVQGDKRRGDQFPPLFYKLLQDNVLSLAQLPFLNSLMYVPFSLYSVKQPSPFWQEATFNGDFHTNTPIIGAKHLVDNDLFKQFAFRINLIGFVGRVQFEEIWMTLLGVYSDNLTFLSLAKQGDDLNENILLAQMVIQTVTSLLLTASRKNSRDKAHAVLCQPDVPLAKHSFGDRFELIRTILHRKSTELNNMLAFYNDSRESEYATDLLSLERLRAKVSGNVPSAESSPNESEQENAVDLYSCLHFLMDLYLQTVQVIGQTSLTCFPIFADIARSCNVVSDLFIEKSQFQKLLQLLQELARIVETFEDELLNQSVIVALAKAYSVIGLADEFLERQKKLILEQHFKDFFLSTRIGAMKSIKYLLTSSNLVTHKELSSICDYICKHFTSDHCIPSCYSAEYVEELWSLSLSLAKQKNAPPIGADFNGKVLNGLLKSLSRSKNTRELSVISNCLEQLLNSGAVNSTEVAIIHGAALKQLKTSASQLSTVHLLKLYFLTSYLLGPANFSVKSQTDSDELFMSMEQLSVIFEPLKCCNSLQASIICQVMGHFLVDFFPAEDLLNKCIGETLSNQQNHYKYLTDILFIIFNKFQNDFHHNDTAQDWVLLSLSSFTQLVPISHALWALTCFLMSASQNHWIRASYPYFQHRFGQFNERDKRSFFTICNNFYNEIKSDENKKAFIKTFQKAACLANSPYFDVLTYLCDI